MADTYNRQQRPTASGGRSNTQNRRPPQKRKKKNPNGSLYAFIGLMAVAVIIIGVLLVLVSNRNEPSENSSSMEASESSVESSVFVSQPSSIPEPQESSEPQEVLKNAWKQENGESYYFDENGKATTGKSEIDGSIYIFAQDGKMLYNCWQTVDGNEYYLLEDGKAAVGEVEIDGKKCHFSSKGVRFALANPWNSVEVTDTSLLVRLPSAYGHETKGLVHKDCYNDLMAMMDDCYSQTGKDVYVISGHRTYNYQKGNYERQVAVFTNQGYSRSEAEKLAAEWVAVPGTSEHHLGYAVDIIDTQIWDLVEEQENLEGQQWLMANSWKYGFILRYPKNTKNETGINYEPWHYRYLGKELAKEVYDSGLTLEGYIKSISK